MFLSLRIALCCVLATALLRAAGAADDPPKPEPFRPVVRPKVPRVTGAARTDVDRFILAALEAKNLALNPEADRATLVRRVSFDLTGLPPTVAEIDAFLADKAPDAYEKMVDRYLASPAYGERWGKLWLDAAGYADSNGYFNADSDRPLAWKYRDYVVKAFNADKPYDRFVREQLAGDEFAGYAPDGEVTAAVVEPLTATHFLRNAPDGSGESDGNPDEVRIDRYTVLEGNVQNLMNCLLGLTVQCARCHDHKFEPITQAEYFGLQVLLFPVYNPEKWTKPNERVVTVGTKAELADALRKTQLIDRQVKTARDGLTAFAEPLREQFLDERLKDLDATTRTAVIDAVKAPKDKRTPAQLALVKTHAKAEVSDDDLAARLPEYGALRDAVKQVVAEREMDRPKPAEKLAVFVETDPNPAVHHLLKRGLHDQPGAEGLPGALEAVNTAMNLFVIEPKPMGRVSTGRRTAFAKWVTSPENPLFARVMVNRVWQHHFGTVLVATADNLGRIRREAVAPGTARLARVGVRRFQVEREGATPAHPHVGGVPTDERAARGVGSDRPGRPAALAFPASEARRRERARRAAAHRWRSGYARQRAVCAEQAHAGRHGRGRGERAGCAQAITQLATAPRAGGDLPPLVRHAGHRDHPRQAVADNGAAPVARAA